MSRFIQEMADRGPKKPKESRKDSSARVLPKPGQYTVSELQNTKKIYSKTGGKY